VCAAGLATGNGPVPAPRRPSRHTLRAAVLEKDRAAAIAAVLASSCQNTGLTPEPGNLGLVREAVLCLINRKRAQSGESPLRPNAELQQSARRACRRTGRRRLLRARLPHGRDPRSNRDREAGYLSDPTAGFVIGENLAWGTYGLATSTAAIVSAWIASPEHLANMLESQYTEPGSGSQRRCPRFARRRTGRDLRAGVRVIVSEPSCPGWPRVVCVRYSGDTRERRWS